MLDQGRITTQDSSNRQSGEFLRVQLDWPSSPDLALEVQDILSAHLGRSIQLRVVLSQAPPLTWVTGPQHFFDAASQTWRCAYAESQTAALACHTCDAARRPCAAAAQRAAQRVRSLPCRQSGGVSEPQTFIGFAAFKYRPGVGVIPSLQDAFRPVSTAFAIAAATNTSSGYPYQHAVESCKARCPTFEETSWIDEPHVGVSAPSRFEKQRSRDQLNIVTRQ